jgi:hypothetical protein
MIIYFDRKEIYIEKLTIENIENNIEVFIKKSF